MELMLKSNTLILESQQEISAKYDDSNDEEATIISLDQLTSMPTFQRITVNITINKTVLVGESKKMKQDIIVADATGLA